MPDTYPLTSEAHAGEPSAPRDLEHERAEHKLQTIERLQKLHKELVSLMRNTELDHLTRSIIAHSISMLIVNTLTEALHHGSLDNQALLPLLKWLIHFRHYNFIALFFPYCIKAHSEETEAEFRKYLEGSVTDFIDFFKMIPGLQEKKMTSIRVDLVYFIMSVRSFLDDMLDELSKVNHPTDDAPLFQKKRYASLQRTIIKLEKLNDRYLADLTTWLPDPSQENPEFYFMLLNKHITRLEGESFVDPATERVCPYHLRASIRLLGFLPQIMTDRQLLVNLHRRIRDRVIPGPSFAHRIASFLFSIYQTLIRGGAKNTEESKAIYKDLYYSLTLMLDMSELTPEAVFVMTDPHGRFDMEEAHLLHLYAAIAQFQEKPAPAIFYLIPDLLLKIRREALVLTHSTDTDIKQKYEMLVALCDAILNKVKNKLDELPPDLRALVILQSHERMNPGKPLLRDDERKFYHQLDSRFYSDSTSDIEEIVEKKLPPQGESSHQHEARSREGNDFTIEEGDDHWHGNTMPIEDFLDSAFASRDEYKKERWHLKMKQFVETAPTLPPEKFKEKLKKLREQALSLGLENKFEDECLRQADKLLSIAEAHQYSIWILNFIPEPRDEAGELNWAYCMSQKGYGKDFISQAEMHFSLCLKNINMAILYLNRIMVHQLTASEERKESAKNHLRTARQSVTLFERDVNAKKAFFRQHRDPTTTNPLKRPSPETLALQDPHFFDRFKEDVVMVEKTLEEKISSPHPTI